jgi:hypothetical protein
MRDGDLLVEIRVKLRLMRPTFMSISTSSGHLIWDMGITLGKPQDDKNDDEVSPHTV